MFSSLLSRVGLARSRARNRGRVAITDIDAVIEDALAWEPLTDGISGRTYYRHSRTGDISFNEPSGGVAIARERALRQRAARNLAARNLPLPGEFPGQRLTGFY